jgi:hypothetical protein
MSTWETAIQDINATTRHALAPSLCGRLPTSAELAAGKVFDCRMHDVDKRYDEQSLYPDYGGWFKSTQLSYDIEGARKFAVEVRGATFAPLAQPAEPLTLMISRGMLSERFAAAGIRADAVALPRDTGGHGRHELLEAHARDALGTDALPERRRWDGPVLAPLCPFGEREHARVARTSDQLLQARHLPAHCHSL